MSPKIKSPRRGVTLIELTVVITMIISLTSSLFISANYYRESANRSGCVVQMEGIQKALRSYQNFNNLKTGDPVAKSDLVGAGKAIPSELFCPHADGRYAFRDEIPAAGESFVTCVDYDSSVGTKDSGQAHNPISTSGW